jgi:outer membrane protein assembly factor BamB
LRRAWSRDLDGAMYAQPLVAAGLAIAATENNTVYAVDVTTGRVRWRTHLAKPLPRAALPCGNIDPSGITGTPAYDAATGEVFVVTESGAARHTLVALDVRTGAVRWQRNADVLPSRDPRAEQERGALLVANNRVYVAFGGRAGDCGNYVGYVAAVSTTGNGSVLHYAVPTLREAGIWAAPGPVAAPGGDILIATGNGAETGARYDGSDSVIRLSPALHKIGLFAPDSWPADNAEDLDLGSMSPVLVGDNVVIAGKRGTVFLLSATLGGIGGQIASLDGCAGYGGAAVHADVVIMPCDGGIRALRVAGTRMQWIWSRSGVTGSPVIAGSVVYAFDNSDLVELSLTTGQTLGRQHVGDVTRFATPAPAGDVVLVGTRSGLVAVRGR